MVRWKWRLSAIIPQWHLAHNTRTRESYRPVIGNVHTPLIFVDRNYVGLFPAVREAVSLKREF